VVSSIEGASRFNDPEYFQLMAGAGVSAASAAALVDRLTAAVERHEDYKALYFARLLTVKSPDDASAWETRAVIAGRLGFLAEQSAAASNEGKPEGQHAVIPSQIVPGNSLAHPVSLEDWAAAMNLLADDTAFRAGALSLVAVRDDASGLQTVQDGDKQYSVSNPVSLEDLLPHSFVLVQARAMSEHNVDGGKVALSIFMAALGGVNAAYGNSGAAATLGDSASQLAGESTNVANHWKGGSFTSRTFTTDGAKDTKDKPKPTGDYHAVGSPVPLVWASGGSLRPTTAMALVNDDGSPAKIKTIRFDASPEGVAKETKIPTLLYPRLAALCHTGDDHDGCTVPVTAMELMLDPADVAAFTDPSTAARLIDESLGFDSWNELYVSKANLSFDSTMISGSALVGYDQKGACYEVGEAPDHWFAAAAPTR
jgi:hypothetical protein